MAISTEEWKNYLDDDQAFLSEVVEGIAGWLDRHAAKRTIDLLRYQEREGVSGSLLEIGIFNGKYFSLLVRSAAQNSERVVGLDTFEYTSKVGFDTYFGDKFSPANLERAADFDMRFIEGPSCDVTPQTALDMLGMPARFVSVDGSHEYDDVLWDLRIADHVLAAGGIISADDYLNPICLGVTAAVDDFISATPTIVPFAYITNKMFLCRPGWADRYRALLEQAILNDTDGDSKSADFRQHVEAGARRNIEACYKGYRVLTVRL